MLEIGHNLRWLADGCEWTITADDPSKISEIQSS